MEKSKIIEKLFLFVLIFVVVYADSHLNYSIQEELGENIYVGNIAEDLNVRNLVSTDQEFASLTYSLLSNTNPIALYFDLNVTTSLLHTAKNLDRDFICEYQPECVLQFNIVIQSPSTGFFKKVQVFVRLIDINDNSPVFDQDFLNIEISESTDINASFPLEGATDRDTGRNGIHSYKISEASTPFIAALDTFVDGRSMLRLIVKQTLDRETTSSYVLEVLAIDGGEPPNTGSLFVNITLTDVNDNPPVFSKAVYNITINEDMPLNSTIIRVYASDKDVGDNGKISFRLSSHQSEVILSKFEINASSGEIILKQTLITSSDESYRIIVEASDSADRPLISQTQVFIRILETHNDYPQININLLSETQFAEISEYASQGQAVAHIAASDTDSGNNGLITCSVISEYFKIQKLEMGLNKEYKVVVSKPLNRELIEQHNVTVSCRDAGTPPKTSQASFMVLISDENDNAPRFSQQTYHIHVSENNPIGNNISRLLATDADLGTNARVRYSIPSGNGHFQIDAVSGDISVHIRLDRESQSKYYFPVLAIDGGNPEMTGSATVAIVVEDVNDNKPVFSRSEYYFSVWENLETQEIIGQVHAKDLDEGNNGNISYSIRLLNSAIIPFSIMKNGAIKVMKSLDREVKNEHIFSVVAVDNGITPLQGFSKVIINVKDKNDNAPVIMFPRGNNNSVSLSYLTQPNSIISKILAYDIDTGLNSKLSYFTRDTNFTKHFLLNSITGEIILVNQIDSTDIGSYSFEVMVQDGGEIPLYSTETMTVNIIAPAPEGISDNFVIAISICSITVILALLIVLAIFLLRRADQRKHRAFNQQINDSFSDKTQSEELDDVDGGFVIPGPKRDVYYPPNYGPPVDTKYNTFGGSKSIEISVIPEDPELIPPDMLAINENERQINQLTSLQYHQSLLKIQNQCKRSNSMLIITIFLLSRLYGRNNWRLKSNTCVGTIIQCVKDISGDTHKVEDTF